MLEQEEEDAGKEEEGATQGINQKVPGCPGRPCAPSVWCGAGRPLCEGLVGSCLRAHLRATPHQGPTFSPLSQGVAPKPGLQRAWTQTRLRNKQKPVADAPYRQDLSQ